MRSTSLGREGKAGQNSKVDRCPTGLRLNIEETALGALTMEREPSVLAEKLQF